MIISLIVDVFLIEGQKMCHINFISYLCIGLFLISSSLFAGEKERSELHWSICEPSIESISKILHFSNFETTDRSVRYFDQKSKHSLFDSGIIIRVRSEGDQWYSTVKVTVDPKLTNIINIKNKSDLHLFSSKEAKCEWDWIGKNKKYHCSLNSPKFDSPFTSNINNVLTTDQMEFLNEYMKTKKGVNFKLPDNIFSTEPVQQQEISFNGLEDIEFNIEKTSVRHGNTQMDFFELSTKTKFKESETKHLMIEKYINENHLNICKIQESKTKIILDLYL